ncbi:MAG: tetratricopeptide repeat protein [Chitinophagaceae bacterium]|nr:MAG: tetratricopeptide repeat protein [Chitinophagaceae bacterium]
MRNKKTNILFILFLLSPLTLLANFDFNANCLKAYQNIFELKLGNARALIANEKKIHPNNAIVPLLENYVDYFYLLTTDSKTEFERLETNKAKRLDQISEDDDKSPYKLYAQGEINLQWALLRARYGSYYTASREINKANNLLEENARKFPAFHLNAKGLGLIQVVMGALPDGFLKSTLAAFGIKGNIQTGLSMLDKLAENLPKSAYEPFFEDVVFNYINVLNDVVHSPNAYQKAVKYTARFAEGSLLKTYLLAYTAAKNGRNDEAIDALNDRPTGAIYQPFAYLDYLMGVTRLNKLDYSAAAYFDRFLQNNKGVSYIKDAYLHLAWIALLKGDEAGYSINVSRAKTNGYTFQEKDKQAVNEANAPMPNKTLLTARLLFDGGYLSQANQTLANVNIDAFGGLKDKAEYYYRLGRINDDWGKEDTAIAHYQSTLTFGKSLKQYYAAKAAVLMGKIYEKKKNYSKARSAYMLAINLKDHDYEAGIENEAKQGLKRIP